LKKWAKNEDLLTKNMTYQIFIAIKHNPKCFLCTFKPKRDKIQHLKHKFQIPGPVLSAFSIFLNAILGPHLPLNNQ
jgi:hypothetical protein